MGTYLRNKKKLLIGKCVHFFLQSKVQRQCKVNRTKHFERIGIRLLASANNFYTFAYDLGLLQVLLIYLPLRLNWTPREHWKSSVMQLDWWYLNRLKLQVQMHPNWEWYRHIRRQSMVRQAPMQMEARRLEHQVHSLLHKIQKQKRKHSRKLPYKINIFI